MEIGYYPDPKHKIRIPKKERKNRIAFVYVFYTGDQARTVYTSLNEELENEGQWTENKQESIDFSLKAHRAFDPGMEYDLIAINHDDRDIHQYDGVTVMKHKNDGFSFGGFKYAWEKLKNKYDYFLFVEQDCCPVKDGWLKEIYDAFHESDDIGAVGNVLETRGIPPFKAPFKIETTDNIELIGKYLKAIGRENEGWMTNLDGAYTFTSADVLREVDKIGGLMVGKCDGGLTGEQLMSSTTNEIKFQQKILQLGYKISAFSPPNIKDTKNIYSYGQRTGSFTRKFDKKLLVPIMHGNMRITCPQMKQYFDDKI